MTGVTEVLGGRDAAESNLDPSGSKSLRLVADQEYFGIAAEALRAGAYLPTRHFRQCALARVVAPMTRDRAKSVLDRACKVAEQINKEWTRNPFRIKTIVVSGSYMTQRKQLCELSLCVGLSKRQEPRPGGATTTQGRDEAGRQIVQAITNLSSFISVRIISERHAVPRPFSVVFQADDFVDETSAPAWGRFLDWSSALTRRLASR